MMKRKQPRLRISLRSQARPEDVYDVIADLQSHLEWAGNRQPTSFRLLTLDAPPGPATVGTVFTSTGTSPMSSLLWEDRSSVTVADRPGTFEFVTEGRVATRSPMTGKYRHLYSIETEADGCRVTYMIEQLAVVNPMLRYWLPVMRDLVWGVAMPKLAGAGLHQLLAYAGERAPGRREAGAVAVGEA